MWFLCCNYTERINSSVPSEQMFLQRLLDRGATESSTTNGNNGSIESGLSSRKTSTAKAMKHIVQNIDSERARNEELVSTFRNGLSSNGEKACITRIECCY